MGRQDHCTVANIEDRLGVGFLSRFITIFTHKTRKYGGKMLNSRGLKTSLTECQEMIRIGGQEAGL